VVRRHEAIVFGGRKELAHLGCGPLDSSARTGAGGFTSVATLRATSP
jgi:hypothetical protein